jgi:hypothetical protein
MVNDTLLNIGKRYKDNLRVIVDQWPTQIREQMSGPEIS